MCRYTKLQDHNITLNSITVPTKHIRDRRNRALYYAPIYDVYIDNENDKTYHILMMNGKVLIIDRQTKVIITFYNMKLHNVKRYIYSDDEQSEKYIKLINNIKNFNRNIF